MTYQRTDVLPNMAGTIYWLAEPQKVLLEALYQVEPDPDPVNLFEGTSFSEQASQSPYLFSITAKGELVSSLMKEPRLFRGLLMTTVTPKTALVSHLQSLLEVRFQQQRKALLRYYDPRVASYLLPSCTDCMLPRWLGPINTLAWFGGTWMDEFEGTLRWHTMNQRNNTEYDSSQPLVLSDEQLQRIVDQGLERFAYRWLNSHPGHDMVRILEKIRVGMAAGHREEGALTGWLDDQKQFLREHYT